MTGILYGIGVGPGDPELMTVKALRYIKNSDIIILPSEPKEECHAYRIVKELVPEIDEKEIICKPFPMIKDRKVLDKNHEQIYREIKDLLVREYRVSFLTIGDPSIYSTYSYIHKQIVEHGGRAVMVNGIPSFCAAAAVYFTWR